MRIRLLLLLCLLPALGSAQRIFLDGFESVTVACASGTPQSATVGDAPDAAFELLGCVRMRNDIAVARVGEISYGGVPVPRAVNLLDAELPRLLVVGPNGQRMPAQFAVLSRWGTSLAGNGPVRWLQITLPADVAGNADTVFGLLRYAAPPPAASDPMAIATGTANGRWQVDTGLALFELDPANPTLFHRIALRDTAGGTLTDVLNYQAGVAGYGPRLSVGNGAGGVLFDAGNEIAGSLRVVDAQIRESGPVQVVVVMNGEFSTNSATSLCAAATPTHESFQYTIEARFSRGSRHADLYVVLRNACSDAGGGQWTDQAAVIRQFQWSWPLTATTPNTGALYYGGIDSSAVTAVAGNIGGTLNVEQRRGAGTPWLRRARVELPLAATTPETAQTFARPVAGLRNDRVLAALHAPWLRFREPQALVVEGDTLHLRMISEETRVGEGKGLWYVSRLNLLPAALATQPAAQLQAWRDAAFAALERGLLPHVAAWNNAGDHWPPLSGNNSSALLQPYLAFINSHHDRNVSETPCTDAVAFAGGQWDCAKTYGQQLWPDIQFNEQFGFVDNATPADNLPYNNYWNASNTELFEFLRSGDPRWVWDFAMPQSWLQAQTATLNLGTRDGTIRNGFVVNSTGNGDGDWHRGNGGSDDYNYNRGAHLAFALRPNHPLRDRFATQGRTVIGRYGVPRAQQNTRSAFVNEIDLDRGPMQHFEALANCAEFVPGTAGTDCQTKLTEILDELAQENLAAGVVCASDNPADPCFFGQQFMINSMFYTFLLRMQQNYGDILHEGDNGSVLRRALVEIPLRYRQYGMPVNGGVIDVDGVWAEAFMCTRAGDGRSVTNCTPFDIEGGNFFFVNRPQTVALLLMSDYLQPDPALCAQARRALRDMFPDPNMLGPLNEYAGGGWWKGASQVTQSLVFAVGLEQRCAE